MPRLGIRAALRGAAGAAVGLVVWLALSPIYDRAVAGTATAVIRLFERPPVTRLVQMSPATFAVNRSDFDPRSDRPMLAVRNLTINFVLLTMLFAAAPRPFSDRNALGFLLATLVLFPTHVFGLVAKVMSIYALQLGPWSAVNYSSFEKNFWGATSHAYTLVLLWAFAFAAWWVFRAPDVPQSLLPRAKTRGRRWPKAG